MKVIASAPTRLSLFGGGTDLPVYSSRYGGMVISMAINLRQHIELNDTGKLELWDGDNKDFFQNILKEFDGSNFGIKHTFDGIIESGLGSSASVTVALLGAIVKAKNIPMNRMEIAEKAWDIEVNKLGLYGGRQDQYASSCGGMNTFWFNPSGMVANKRFVEHEQYIKKFILLFYSGKNRESTKIQENLKVLTPEKVNSLHQIKRIATLAKKSIEFGDMKMAGRYLDDAWQFKKASNNQVTNERINRIYDEAILAGAMGGKVMGSGGGGYMFFLAEPRYRQSIIQRLSELGCTYVDFSIDNNGLDTRIL